MFRKLLGLRSFHSTAVLPYEQEFENPIKRTLRILADDLNFKKKFERFKEGLPPPHDFPKHADIVIIGGGAVGSSTALWLKEKSCREGFRVVVIEKDPTYKSCTASLSPGGLRSQFALPENIQMALFGAEFIRGGKKLFGRDFNVNFQPHGYLSLANEDEAGFLEDCHKMRREMGASSVLLGSDALKQRFPWMDVSGVELGCLGIEKEGWFAPMELLEAIQKKAVDLGTQYITGEVVEFGFNEMDDIYMEGVRKGSYQGLQSVIVTLPDGEKKVIEFAICVIAAGYETKKVAELARVGTGEGLLSLSLPLRKMKRHLCYFDCLENPPGLNTPMVSDYNYVYFRRHNLGGSFIAGISRSELEEERLLEGQVDKTEELKGEVDQSIFEDVIKPALVQRVPAFNNVKLNGFWNGSYEYNTYDLNGVIGPHPYYNNLYLASGFSGQGIQQAPALGRGLAELILDGRFMTIDLTRLGFDRMVVDKPMYEIAPY